MSSVLTSTLMKRGGILLSLPRELRDQIYRYLVPGKYLVGARPPRSSDIEDKGDCPGMETQRRDLAILSVSKLVSREAMEILYSESIFRLHFHYDLKQTFRFEVLKSFQRMMNIDLDGSVIWGTTNTEPLYLMFPLFRPVVALDYENRTWKTAKDLLGVALRFMSHLDTFRNTLRIRWLISTQPSQHDARVTIPGWSDADLAIPNLLFLGMRSLTQFRTIVLQTSVAMSETSIKDESGGTVKHLESKMEAIKEYLEPKLGPGVVLHAHDRDHQRYMGTLTFHPQEHCQRSRRVELESPEQASWSNINADGAEKGV